VLFETPVLAQIVAVVGCINDHRVFVEVQLAQLAQDQSDVAIEILDVRSVMHAMDDETDMRRYGGLRKLLPITFATFGLGYLAIIGVPPFAGFFSKDEILAGAYNGPLGKPALFWMGTLTAALTALYMFRGLYMTFFGKSRVEPEAVYREEVTANCGDACVWNMLAVFRALGAATVQLE